ncbi:MAG: PA domain-containing protein, partial [Thiotrichaceae bacterium]
SDDVGYALNGLTIISPADAEKTELLTTLYYDTPGTGPEGITAVLVDVNFGTKEDYENPGDVTGKIVLIHRNDALLAWNTQQAYNALTVGAAAAVFYGYLGDYPFDDAIKQDPAGVPLPSFSISENDAAYLKSLMGQGPVTLKLYAETSDYLYWPIYQSNVSHYDEELSMGIVPMERTCHGTAIQIT